MEVNKEEFYKVIGRNIKKFRQEYNKTNKMTQEMLAEYLNVSTSLISKLESDKQYAIISIELLYKISVLFNKSISSFLEEK